MDDDPLERLLGELLDAHDRNLEGANESSTTALRKLWRARPIVASAAALALTASAAAAVVIETRTSAPLRGRLPELLGSRYALDVEPDLRAGHAGWCIKLHAISSQGMSLPNPGTCVSAGRSPLVTSGGIAEISTTTGAVAGWLLYAVVTERVAELRAPNGARILPISSPELPKGWRAAITIEAPGRLSHHGVRMLTPLNAAGKVLPTYPTKLVVLPTLKANHGKHKLGCSISASQGTNIRVLRGYQLRQPTPRSIPVANGFVSCYSATVGFQSRTSTVAVLIDAKHSTGRAATLPGLKRMRLHPDVWAQPKGSEITGNERLFARRLAAGWLVIRTSGGPDEAFTQLDHLVVHDASSFG